MKHFFLAFVLIFPNLCFSFSAKDFEENRKRICQPFTPDERDEDCHFENFEIVGHDLNKDGVLEWFIYGPKPLGGAHGNCNLSIIGASVAPSNSKAVGASPSTPHSRLFLEHGKSGWRLLYQDYGNSRGDEVLKTSHRGYLDLNISSADTGWAWTKQKAVWSGKTYQIQGQTSYYLYDEKKLQRVSKARWEKCVQKGEGCLQ